MKQFELIPQQTQNNSRQIPSVLLTQIAAGSDFGPKKLSSFLFFKSRDTQMRLQSSVL